MHLHKLLPDQLHLIRAVLREQDPVVHKAAQPVVHSHKVPEAAAYSLTEAAVRQDRHKVVAVQQEVQHNRLKVPVVSHRAEAEKIRHQAAHQEVTKVVQQERDPVLPAAAVPEPVTLPDQLEAHLHQQAAHQVLTKKAAK